MAKRTPTLRTIAMPANTNPSGDIFGGWIVSQMDLAGGLVSSQHAKSRTVTAAISELSFIKPVHIGDTVTCYVEILKTGNTSITEKIETYASDRVGGREYKVTEGTFIFVAINDKGKPWPVDEKLRI